MNNLSRLGRTSCSLVVNGFTTRLVINFRGDSILVLAASKTQAKARAKGGGRPIAKQGRIQRGLRGPPHLLTK